MGIQDRDYYREHRRAQDRREEMASGPARSTWRGLFVLLLIALCIGLGVKLRQVSDDLAASERQVRQLRDQIKADRERAAAVTRARELTNQR